MQLQPCETVMFQTTAMEQCTVCVWSNHFFHLSFPLPPHSDIAQVCIWGMQRAACTEPLQWHKDCCGHFAISWLLECTQSSLAGSCHYCDSHCSFHLGNYWFTWWFEVKEARPGFWGWHCKCSGKWTALHLPSAAFFSLDLLCWQSTPITTSTALCSPILQSGKRKMQ